MRRFGLGALGMGRLVSVSDHCDPLPRAALVRSLTSFVACHKCRHMEWKLDERPEAIVVELCSNPVNKQNEEYLQDLEAAFDRLDAEWPGKPAILTAKGKIFSAGLDFDYVFPMFEKGDQREVAAWFTDYRRSMMRVFTSPRLTIAALNGHAFAGGLVLALCCDFRVAAHGDARFALNEVPIGIPMPSVYDEVIRFRLGDSIAAETILLGRTYSTEEALKLRVVNQLTEAGGELAAALAMAAEIPELCWPAYAHSKRCLLAPVLDRIDRYGEQLERDTYSVMTSPSSIKRQAEAHARLKSKK